VRRLAERGNSTVHGVRFGLPHSFDYELTVLCAPLLRRAHKLRAPVRLVLHPARHGELEVIADVFRPESPLLWAL